MIAQDNWRTIFDGYIADVMSGAAVVSSRVRAAVERHLSDLEREDSPWYFDDREADNPCDFISLLTLNTGRYAGKRFELQPWQVFLLRTLFGWRCKQSKFRRFHQAYISMARGNGKSPLAAAIQLFLCGFDSPIEQRAECYCAATTKQQARIVFDDCKRFVSKSPALRARFNTLLHSMTMTATDSRIMPLGSDSHTLDGLVPHSVVVDELHAWKEQHRGVWEKLQTAMGKRDQPLLAVITTAGDDMSTLWSEVYAEACAVVDRGNGIENDRLFVFVAELDPDDDPFDESTWPKANPMLDSGVVQWDRLRTEAQRVEVSPTRRLPFIRYHCNRWVTSSDKPITPAIWAKGNRALPELDGVRAFGGFDWGFKDDLAALGWVIPLEESIEGKRVYAVTAHCWAPSDCKHRSLSAEPWRSWVDDGWLTVCDGDTVDTDAIYRQLEEDARRFDVQSIAYDEYNARDFENRLLTHYGLRGFAFRQNCAKYNEPLKEFIAALSQGRIIHGGNPLLAWCASNLVIRSDSAGYIMPDKRRSQDKIDPIVALVMALSEAMFAERKGPSYYDEHELERF